MDTLPPIGMSSHAWLDLIPSNLCVVSISDESISAISAVSPPPNNTIPNPYPTSSPIPIHATAPSRVSSTPSPATPLLQSSASPLLRMGRLRFHFLNSQLRRTFGCEEWQPLQFSKKIQELDAPLEFSKHDLFPQSLVDAYHQTHYTAIVPASIASAASITDSSSSPSSAAAPTVMEIKLKRHHPELDALLTYHNEVSGVFITAWNPFSQPQSEEVNEAKAKELEQDVLAREYVSYPHIGKSPDGSWEEHGLFVVGINREDSIILAKKYGQNAIVYVERSKWPQLVWTHEPHPKTFSAKFCIEEKDGEFSCVKLRANASPESLQLLPTSLVPANAASSIQLYIASLDIQFRLPSSRPSRSNSPYTHSFDGRRLHSRNNSFKLSSFHLSPEPFSLRRVSKESEEKRHSANSTPSNPNRHLSITPPAIPDRLHFLTERRSDDAPRLISHTLPTIASPISPSPDDTPAPVLPPFDEKQVVSPRMALIGAAPTTAIVTSLEDVSVASLPPVKCPAPMLIELAADQYRCMNMMYCALLNGRFVHSNSRFQEALGWSEDDLLRMSVKDLFHPEDLPNISLASVYAASKRFHPNAGPPDSLESQHGMTIDPVVVNRLRTKKGDYLTLVFRTAVSATYSGTIDPFLAKNADTFPRSPSSPPVETQVEPFIHVMARPLFAQERTALSSALEGIVKQQSEFVSNVTHELQTPMNGIVVSTEMLASTELTPEQMDYLNCISVSAEHMSTMINDIISFSAIEQGRLRLDPSQLFVNNVIEEAITICFRPRQHDHLEILHSIAADVPASVLADISRVRQLLVHQISNSLKFTKMGYVSISVSKYDGSAAPARLIAEYSEHIQLLKDRIASGTMDADELKRAEEELSGPQMLVIQPPTIIPSLFPEQQHQHDTPANSTPTDPFSRISMGTKVVSATEQERAVAAKEAAKQLSSSWNAPTGNETIMLQFAIEDSGRGIDARHANRLFQIFSQLDSSSSKEHQGTGLGLLTSLKLARAMKGDMWIKSTAGRGSTFYFTIQVELPTIAQTSTVSAVYLADGTPVQTTLGLSAAVRDVSSTTSSANSSGGGAKARIRTPLERVRHLLDTESGNVSPQLSGSASDSDCSPRSHASSLSPGRTPLVPPRFLENFLHVGVVDANSKAADVLASDLRNRGARVKTFYSCSEALSYAESSYQPLDCWVIDALSGSQLKSEVNTAQASMNVNLPNEINGIQLIEQLLEVRKNREQKRSQLAKSAAGAAVTPDASQWKESTMRVLLLVQSYGLPPALPLTDVILQASYLKLIQVHKPLKYQLVYDALRALGDQIDLSVQPSSVGSIQSSIVSYPFSLHIGSNRRVMPFGAQSSEFTAGGLASSSWVTRKMMSRGGSGIFPAGLANSSSDSTPMTGKQGRIFQPTIPNPIIPDAASILPHINGPSPDSILPPSPFVHSQQHHGMSLMNSYKPENLSIVPGMGGLQGGGYPLSSPKSAGPVLSSIPTPSMSRKTSAAAAPMQSNLAPPTLISEGNERATIIASNSDSSLASSSVGAISSTAVVVTSQPSTASATVTVPAPASSSSSATSAIATAPGAGTVGANVSVQMPRTKSASAADANFARKYPLNILVVEDHPVNLKLVLKVLSKLGYQADTSVDGNDAQRKVLQRMREKGKTYDVMLLDLQMPICDGFEAATSILNQFGCCNLPEVVRARGAKCIHHTDMPAEDAWYKSLQQGGSPAATTLIHSFGDDYQRVLSPAGPVDGTGAGTHFTFPRMPEINNADSKVGEAEKPVITGPRPIIMALTANTTEEDRLRCLKIGFDEFISKPINIADLMQPLKKWGKKLFPSPNTRRSSNNRDRQRDRDVSGILVKLAKESLAPKFNDSSPSVRFANLNSIRPLSPGGPSSGDDYDHEHESSPEPNVEAPALRALKSLDRLRYADMASATSSGENSRNTSPKLREPNSWVDPAVANMFPGSLPPAAVETAPGASVAAPANPPAAAAATANHSNTTNPPMSAAAALAANSGIPPYSPRTLPRGVAGGPNAALGPSAALRMNAIKGARDRITHSSRVVASQQSPLLRTRTTLSSAAASANAAATSSILPAPAPFPASTSTSNASSSTATSDSITGEHSPEQHDDV